MKIAIIGTGNVGAALATGWANAGHTILLGVRNTQKFKGKHLLDLPTVALFSIAEAVQKAEVVLLAVPPAVIPEVAAQLQGIQDKIFIDPTNAFPAPPEGYTNSFEAWKYLLDDNAKLVKAFNNTGFENMLHPKGLDTFVAGDSEKAKKIAIQLAVEIGFNTSYDFGTAEKAGLLEQLAICWIHLAYFQGLGTSFGINIIRND